MIKIKKNHVSDEVVLYLRKRILLNQLKEGDHLKELEISKSLDVSRGPVREAISELEKEGLVETPSNGRTIVSKFDEGDIKNLYDTRILLEKHAVTQINSKKLKNNLPILYSLVEELENAYKQGVKDVESDLAFHASIVKMTGNKTLIQLWLSLNGLIQSLIEVTSSFTELRQEEIIMEHKSIIDALVKEDIDEAQMLIEEHLKAVQTLLLKEL